MNLSTPAQLRWLELILEERFGVEFRLQERPEGLFLHLQNADGSILFDRREDFQKSSSEIPCAAWNASTEGWGPLLESALPAPGVERIASPLIELRGNDYVVHYDILGLAYWMMARLEEIGCTTLDVHGRFPVTSAHAFMHGYLDRPIVDEWLHLLGQVLQRRWPQVEIKRHRFSVSLSHDVDRPFQYLFLSPINLARQLAGDVLKRRNLKLAFNRLTTWRRVRSGEISEDPFNTFDWIMDVSEQHGLTSAFYFLSDGSHPLDGDYELKHVQIRALLQRIHGRGHEIGLHPSYGTFRDPSRLKEEADRLRRICDEEGIRQEKWGGRMHYLRWEHPLTLRGWEAANMAYDSTMTYGDNPGFRCGTCFEYPAFDAEQDRILNVRVRPLIVMSSGSYGMDGRMKSDTKNSIEHVSALIEMCKKVQGVFTLLWHNSDLDPTSKAIYLQLINEAKFEMR